jgi:hypothetical protein
MGLTIYYRLSLSQNLPSEQVRDLVQRVADHARELGCADVGRVKCAFEEPLFSRLFVQAGRPEDGCFGHVPARAGWVVEIWPGEGCESAFFGLCQYPRTVPYELHGRPGWVRTEYRRGWLFRGACKTQYAAELGWEHFLRCHQQVLGLLRFWRQLGVRVKVRDEGDYWRYRSERRLRETLRLYDRLVAVVAGACKDAAEQAGKGFQVESLTLARTDFERLEAEGRRALSEPLPPTSTGAA